MPRFSHTLFLFVLFASLAQAHELWVERQGEVPCLQYGRLRSDHRGAKKLAYRPEQVRQASCFDVHGRPLPVVRGQAHPVSLHVPCAASFFLFVPGDWSKTPYDTKDLPKPETGPVSDSRLSVASVKRLDAWGEALARPLTQELEIVPLINPLRPGAKDELPLLVSLEGRPVAEATLLYSGRPRGASGADGRIGVRLQGSGLHLVQARLVTLLHAGRADRMVAALQFETAQCPGRSGC